MNGSGVISQLKEAEFRLDRVCRQFEQAWRQNRRLTIEHCLNLVEPVERPHLLEELIASEWELRVRQGDNPETAEYVGRFPNDEDLVVAICGVLAAEYANSKDRGINSTPQPGEHLGDYKIIREVGRGGMGIVYEARQESLGRQVALKVLPARRFRSERELQRFRREAQAVARLHHSHIVEIYGVGEQDGVHYFAMRYVTGRGLDQVIAELRYNLGLNDDEGEVSVLNEPRRPGQRSYSSIHSGSSLLLSRALTSPPDSIDSTTASSRYRAVARIGFQVAEALQYAHERGIQHRDVKPSNLLIDRHEVVWLSDFGLAKLDLDAVDITESDDLVGTMKYMPPEALTGKIDHRSDIYSLGLTLYELVTLRPALDGADRAQLLEQVKEPQIPAPRWLVPDVPRDLETIILKAMARDLDQRYQSARELAADLERFLNHEPIRARPQSTFTKFRRWVERKPLMAFLALGTLSITSTSLFAFGALYVNALATAKQARQDRDLAKQLLQVAEDAKTSSETSRKAAEVSTREAQNRLIQAQRAEAATYLQQGDDFAALAWTAETLRSQRRLAGSADSAHDQDATTDAAGNLALEPALRLRVGAIMDGSPRIVLREWLPKLATAADDANFQADGVWFVADAASVGTKADRVAPGATQYLCVANPERTRLLRWNLTSGQRESLTIEGLAGGSVFTNTGTRRVTYGTNRTLQHTLLNPGAHDIPATLADPPTTRQIQLQAAWESPDARWLLVSFQTLDGEVIAGLWDLASGHLAYPALLPVNGHQLQVEFSTDSQRVLISTDQHVQILDLPECQPLLPNEQFQAGTHGWSRDGRWFAGQVQGQTCLYQVDSPLAGASQVLATPVAREVSFQNDASSLAVMLPRGRVAFYQLSARQTFDFQDSVHPHEIDAHAFAYSPDGQWYAMGHEDGNVRVWSTQSHQPWTGILRHPGAVRTLQWSAGGELLVTVTQKGLVTVWDMSPRATGQMFFHPDAAPLQNVRFSPDGKRVAVAGTRGQPIVWEIGTGEQLSRPRPDGVFLSDTGVGPGLAPDDLKRAAPKPDGERSQRIAWNSDGSWLAGLSIPRNAADDMMARHLQVDVWETQFGLRQPLATDSHPLHPATPGDRVRPMLTADGRLLVPEAGRASLLSLADFQGTQHFEISKDSWPVLVQLSPDSRYAAILDSAEVVSLFQVSTNTLVRRWLLPSAQHPSDMIFNRQGTMLAMAGKLGLQVWETATGKQLTPPMEADPVGLLRVRFSPDGEYVATLSENHVCQIRSTKTWNWRGSGFQLESRPVLAEFCVRDNTFVTATEAGVVQIWDWSRGEPLTPPYRHPCSLTDADLSTDGRQIAVVGGESLCVWPLPQPSSLTPEEIAAWARDVALTDVNTADGTLAPLLPNQFPERAFQKSWQRANPTGPGCDSRCQWHLHQANMAHLLRDESAEDYHIKRLSLLNPDHPQLQMLRARSRP